MTARVPLGRIIAISIVFLIVGLGVGSVLSLVDHSQGGGDRTMWGAPIAHLVGGVLLVFGTVATFTISEGEHRRGTDHDRSQRFREWTASESDPLLHTVAWANILAVARKDNSYAEAAARLAVESIQRYLTDRCLDPRCGAPASDQAGGVAERCPSHAMSERWLDPPWQALLECRGLDPDRAPAAVELSGRILRTARLERWAAPPSRTRSCIDLDLSKCALSAGSTVFVSATGGVQLLGLPTVEQGASFILDSQAVPAEGWEFRGPGDAALHIRKVEGDVDISGLVVAPEARLSLHVPKACKLRSRHLEVNGHVIVNASPESTEWDLNGVSGEGTIVLDKTNWTKSVLKLTALKIDNQQLTRPAISLDGCHFDAAEVSIDGLTPRKYPDESGDYGSGTSVAADVRGVSLVNGSALTWLYPMNDGHNHDELRLTSWLIEGLRGPINKDRHVRLHLDGTAPSGNTGRLAISRTRALGAQVALDITGLMSTEIEVNLDDLASDVADSRNHFDATSTLRVTDSGPSGAVTLRTLDPLQLEGVGNEMAGVTIAISADPSLEEVR